MEEHDNAKSGLLLVGGILLGVVALGAILAPTALTLTEEEVSLAIGFVMILVGAFVA